jgi:hypothetical protein
MKKILVALIILSAGAGAFQIVRQSTNRIQEENETLHQALTVETQRLAAAQSEQAGLAEHGAELKRTLAVTRPSPENELWSALQTNRADRLPDKMRERLWDEFGFTWQSFRDYIVVSKNTVRKLDVRFLESNGQLNDAALAALAITPDERGRVEAAIEQAKTDFKDWVLAHVKRAEPGGDVVARYTLEANAKMARGISSNFWDSVGQSIGEQRTELFHKTADQWMKEMGVSERSTSLTIRREMVEDEPRFKVETRESGANKRTYLPLKNDDFPKALQPLFPNRWASLAEREGFELPEAPQKK